MVWGCPAGAPPHPPFLSHCFSCAGLVRTRTEQGQGELLVGSVETAEKLNSRVCGRNSAKGLN